MTSNLQTTYKLPIRIEGLQVFHSNEPFDLDLGNRLSELNIGYHTYGELNKEKNNVIWVCHALTANSDVADWWSGLFGKGLLFDPDKYFIVCANILGSCYGTTGARSINPKMNEPYGTNFPRITIRDMVAAHDLLRQHLGIHEIALCIGGSCGGHQVMEFAYQSPNLIKQIALLVTSPNETAWAIAIHEAGRMAIEADPSFGENTDKAASNGLKAARALGLLAYRTVDAYINTQSNDDDRTDDFSAASYVQYQGSKLEQRFYAHCYWSLLKALDTHNVGRGRGGFKKALESIKIPALVIGIDTDQLIPPMQQKMLAANLANATYQEIHSDFGHDGFLIETEQINRLILDWWEGR